MNSEQRRAQYDNEAIRAVIATSEQLCEESADLRREAFLVCHERPRKAPLLVVPLEQS